jgi:hypothetical protein
MEFKLLLIGAVLVLLLLLSGCAWDAGEGYYSSPYGYNYDIGYYYGGPVYHAYYHGDYDHDRDHDRYYHGGYDHDSDHGGGYYHGGYDRDDR